MKKSSKALLLPDPHWKISRRGQTYSVSGNSQGLPLEAIGNLYFKEKASLDPSKKACPLCHTTVAEFERTGLLGCSACYDVFATELDPNSSKSTLPEL